MSNDTLNDIAWEKFFEKYGVLDRISQGTSLQVSAHQMKEFREPRLMAKFDHKKNLPRIFLENHLSILPVTRGDYVISKFEAYHNFEKDTFALSEVIPVSIPSHIQSLDPSNITSENIALNCALVSGILTHFVNDEEIVPTVSGRMGTGTFEFDVKSSANKKISEHIVVKNVQMEIDAAYEGISHLALIEAKLDVSEDFLIRQLYYPYRVWESRIAKSVKPIFLVYSNGIYRLYEYQFLVLNDYNSITLVKQANYSIEDTTITVQDIQKILEETSREREASSEPHIPFPQADKFERVINLCELIQQTHELSREIVTEEYDFDSRQTSYYADAARYLGLIEKITKNRRCVKYRLSSKGKKILKYPFKSRQLAYCQAILSHKPFAEILTKYLTRGVMPTQDEIIRTMQYADIYSVKSEETFKRRSSTIRSWINWIVGLINED